MTNNKNATDMKTNFLISKKTSIYSLFGLILVVLTSCGSYQNKSYYDNDGIYEDSSNSRINGQNNDTSKYKEYFSALNKENEEIFTNVDDYSSFNDVDNSRVQDQEGLNNHSGWGSNANDNITVNVYDNNWGGGLWNNWGWNNWGWGWNNWGWNNWGWNNWGWNGFYGPGLGLGWGWNNWGWNNGFYTNQNFALANGGRNRIGANTGGNNYYYGRNSTISPTIRNTNGNRNSRNIDGVGTTRNYNNSNTTRNNATTRNNSNTREFNNGTTRNNSNSNTREFNNSNTRNTNTSPTRSNTNSTPRYSPSPSSTPRSSGGGFSGGRSGGGFGGGRSGGGGRR